ELSLRGFQAFARCQTRSEIAGDEQTADEAIRIVREGGRRADAGDSSVRGGRLMRVLVHQLEREIEVRYRIPGDGPAANPAIGVPRNAARRIQPVPVLFAIGEFRTEPEDRREVQLHEG